MKKYLSIIILTIILLSLAGTVWAQERDYPTIVQDYPKLKACEDNQECRPGEAKFGLPQFIKYIFIFSLGIVGIIGLLAMIIGAWDYVMSAGNPQKAAQGKDKIVSALLGLLLLIGSAVLLNLINPDLLKLRMEKQVVKVGLLECQEQCAAQGPPSPACLEECEKKFGEEEQGCRYIDATLAPTTLDVGESMILTLKRQNCPNFKNHRIFLTLKQTKGSGTTYYDEIINNGTMITATATEWKEKFTFVGAVNMIENEPEEPYLEGWIEIPNQSKQYIPRINIILIDNK